MCAVTSIDMSEHMSLARLVKYSAPSIVMLIFTSIYNIVDGLFVANFAGSTAFAGVNLIMPAIMMLSAPGFMVGTGGTALVAKTRGQRQDALACAQFSLLVYFACALGCVLAVVGIVAAPQIATVLGAQGEMLAVCVTYGRIVMATIPFFMLQCAFQSFFACAGKPLIGFGVVVCAGVANIVLDAVLVGACGLGYVGAAVATCVGEVIGGAVPLVYFSRKNASYLRLGRPVVRGGGAVIARACLNGSSEMVTNIAVSFVSMVYNWQLLAYIGPAGVSAYGVIMYTMMIFNAFNQGFSMGTAPLVSFQYGAKNPRELASLLRKSLLFVFSASACVTVAAQIFAGPISALFVGYDAELCALTTHAYKVFAISFLLMGFAIYTSAFFTALNNGVVSAVISFLRTLVFETSAVVLLPKLLGIDGIWYAISVSETLSAILCVIFLLALRRRYGY
jgi:Na+-driven multidrug efflux pump